jgi:hypothetical protein
MVPAQHRFENLLRERKKIQQGLKGDGKGMRRGTP